MRYLSISILFFLFLIGGLPRISDASSQTQLYTPFVDKLTVIKQELIKGKLSSAIYFIQELENKLINQRQEELDILFPLHIGVFKAEPYSAQERGTGLDGESFGVILSKRYINDDGHYIEILLVNDDEAINEYKLLIKNPNLITGMSDARIIQLHGYNAIEKWLPEQKIIEQNAIINSHLMMNIFSKGVESPKVVEKFLEKIPFKEIESHLKN
jgi:hypothetical protein